MNTMNTMNILKFNSNITKDEIIIIINKEEHKSKFNIKTIDNTLEHIQLIKRICYELENLNIKWVNLEIDFEPIIPVNTLVSYISNNSLLSCHIADFENFYFTNITNIIKQKHIHIQQGNKICDDGWITVVDLKTERKNKYNNIKNELSNLVYDWNTV